MNNINGYRILLFLAGIMNLMLPKLVKKSEHEGHSMVGYICVGKEAQDEHYKNYDDITAVHLNHIHLAINRYHWKLNLAK